MSESAASMPAPPASAPGGQVRLLDGGAEAFPRMIAAIGTARRSVHLEIYTFELDAVGQAFVEALSAAARRGVQVRVIMDGWGSMLSGPSIASELRLAGVRVSIYHPFSALLMGRVRRNHRKLLLVDDAVAIVGGINIGEEYATTPGHPGWADLALEVHGEAATSLGARLRRERPRLTPSGPVRIHLSGLGGGRKLRERYLLAIQGARRHIALAHAYFLPDRRLARALRRAARGGVHVTLLLAGRSDVPFARVATLRLYREFLKAGVRIFEWHRSVLHAKAAVVDDQLSLVGSFNLDPFSLANLEALVEVDSPRVAADVQHWVDVRLREAREVTLEDCRREGVRGWLLDLLGLLAARTSEWLGRALAWRRPRPIREAAEGPLPRLGARPPKG